MERLTKHNGRYCDNCGCSEEPDEFCACDEEIAMYEKLMRYENTGLEPEEISNIIKGCSGIDRQDGMVTMFGKPLSEWYEIAKAEEQGRLVVLPCKVGDMVYYRRGRDTIGDTVERIILDGIDNQVLIGAHKVYLFWDFGKNVFLTRKEAEKSLEGKE